MNSIFDNIKTIAIVGLSDKPDRPSYEVGKYLQSQGFEIIPINPNISEWEGLTSYKDLSSVPSNIMIDVVDIFRRSDEVMGIVEEAVLRSDAHTIWMQEGVSEEEAKEYAENNGLTVVMDFCLMKAHKREAPKDTEEQKE
ncbi:MAG: CoA-binding protein [Patescibacteria group bacterium]